MTYPEDMTAEDIAEFEYEYNRYLDRFLPDSLIEINEELAQVAFEQRVQEEVDLPFQSLYN